MNNFIFSILCSILIVVGCTAPQTPSFIEGKYNQAMALRDYSTAIVYLHELLALDSTDCSLYGRLADLYKRTRNHRSCILSADRALQEANKLQKKDLLFLKATAFEAEKMYVDAVGMYDLLIKLDASRALEYTYKTAELYYFHKDIGNALIRADKVANFSTSRISKKLINSELGKDEVSYYHAALNFMAFIKIQTKEFEVAERLFGEIFKETQLFKLANRNYQLLQKAKTEAVK